MGRFFTVLVLASALCAGVAWQLGLFVSNPSTSKPLGVKPPPPLGDDLYQGHVSAVQSNPPSTGRVTTRVRANLVALHKMDAAPQVPGQILFIGQEIPEGVAQVGGVGPLMQGSIQSATVDVGDTTHCKFYHRISEGDKVKKDDMVALIDPAKAIHGVREKVTKLAAAEAEKNSAEKIYVEAERRYELDKRLYAQGIIAEKELADSRLTAIKTWGDYIAKREAANVTRNDVTLAKLTLSQHYVRNKLPVEWSIIKTIHRRTGEAVKELEPVVNLYAEGHMTAEGLVEVQFKDLIKRGRKVTIEASLPTSPVHVWRSHRKEITAVAVAIVGAEHLAASASEDETVCLWSEKYSAPVATLSHPAPVRTLACSPNLLLAGLADGTIHVWDLSKTHIVDGNLVPTDGAKGPIKPAKILTAHGDAVTALAFGDKGHYFASGSTDGSIALWDATLPEYHVYRFDAEHGVTNKHTAQITALHFTPEAKLVSASKDNTLRIWKLFKKGAELVGNPIAGRSGKVTALGVSRDGSAILFDQDKTLQILSSDGKTIATMQNPLSFETFAVFSPNAKLLLTAGDSEGRLQLWNSPLAGQRAYELRQFMTSERAPATAAAFFEANPNGDVPFAVSGTKDGIVYLWPLPSQNDVINHRITGVELTQISNDIETRQIHIGVQVPNDGRLVPGQPVWIVIE